jgi:hypothetical protein
MNLVEEFEGGIGDSYKCTGGIADDHGYDYGKTAGNTREKWSKILVKKGHTVWGIYSNEPTSAELEEFIKQNPYIAARRVGREQNGNIINLTIRVGEITLVHNFAIYLSKYHAT